MGTLLVNARPEFFSQVPLLQDVVPEFTEKQVIKQMANIGEIFVKYNMFDKFGITMAHRHFEMALNEILVESINEDSTLSVATPWTIISGSKVEPADIELLSSYSIEMPQEKFVIPQSWVFGSSGEAIPFEYVATHDPTLMSAPPTEFARELYAALKALGVERLVGLRSIENKGEGSSWETTPEKVRANVTVFGEMPKDISRDKMVKVLWTFNANGKIEEGNISCFLCWCNHCGSCTHCGNCTH